MLPFTASTVALVGGGSFEDGATTASLLALAAALAGMALASWVRGHISEAMFRPCVFLGLLGLGLHLVVAVPV